jgi:hypothetical protein
MVDIATIAPIVLSFIMVFLMQMIDMRATARCRGRSEIAEVDLQTPVRCGSCRSDEERFVVSGSIAEQSFHKPDCRHRERYIRPQ